ncbi:MAG: hypothetical protein Q9184_004269, partial [Pyrenodesmia sp. 2 TL-2023]
MIKPSLSNALLIHQTDEDDTRLLTRRHRQNHVTTYHPQPTVAKVDERKWYRSVNLSFIAKTVPQPVKRFARIVKNAGVELWYTATPASFRPGLTRVITTSTHLSILTSIVELVAIPCKGLAVYFGNSDRYLKQVRLEYEIICATYNDDLANRWSEEPATTALT